MKQVRILLEYGTYPIWLYDEKSDLIDTVLPDELKGDLEMEQLCDEIQDIFEGLFTDTKIVFEYHGFSSTEDEAVFIAKLDRLVRIATERLGDSYLVVNDINDRWKTP